MHPNPENYSSHPYIKSEQNLPVNAIISRVKQAHHVYSMSLGNLVCTPLTRERIAEASSFFSERMSEMGLLGYNQEEIIWNCENHSVQELTEKIQDPTRYFEIICDDKTGNIVAYFESKQTKKAKEAILGQFVQWIFVHPAYGTNGLARNLFENFHDFCLLHRYVYAGSMAKICNIGSQEMHNNLGYRRLPSTHKESDLVLYRKEFSKELHSQTPPISYLSIT